MMFNKALQQKKNIGIYFAADGVAIAEIDASDDQLSSLKSCQYFTAADPAERLQQLEQYIKQHGLKKRPCSVVLEGAYYNLIQMAAPPVADDELKNALRWSVKDFVDYPVDEAVIDVFRVPVQQNKEAKVFVVTSKKEDVQQAVDFVRKLGLNLQSIDIEELSLGNIVRKIPGHEKGIALLNFEPHHGSINLYHDSALYVSRRIDTGLERLEELQSLGSELTAIEEQVYDPIILELQRSLDFYESEFAKPPISQLLVSPKHPVLQSFVDYAESHSGLRVEFIHLPQLFPDSTELDDEANSNCVLAISAASRVEGLGA